MINNKKGLSTVVTTLIIILLVLVAIGIVWVVVRGVIDEGAANIEFNTKCLQIDVKATQVVNTGGTDYDVTLTRGSTGDDIAGVKMVLFNSLDSSSVIDSPGNIGLLTTVTRSLAAVGIANANKIEVTAYLKDTQGNDHVCQTFVFNF